MKTSTTILEKIEKVLLLPGWRYVPFHFTPYYPPLPQSRREDAR
jgi:hypothetical protein